MSPVYGLDMTEPPEDGLLDKVKVNIPMRDLVENKQILLSFS
jgi:hypothetical protein